MVELVLKNVFVAPRRSPFYKTNEKHKVTSEFDSVAKILATDRQPYIKVKFCFTQIKEVCL